MGIFRKKPGIRPGIRVVYPGDIVLKDSKAYLVSQTGLTELPIREK